TSRRRACSKSGSTRRRGGSGFCSRRAGAAIRRADKKTLLFWGGDIVGLTTLGVFHAAIRLVAVVCGIWAFARYKKISLNNRLGQLYLASTLITAVTALGIFQHGGFGPPHALAVLTLVALAVGGSAEIPRLFG